MSYRFRHLVEPGDDRQKESLAILLAIMLVVLGGWWCGGWVWRAAHPAPPPALPTCSAEDEILVTITSDAYAWHAGDHRCVHIDNIRPTTKEKG